MTSEPTSLFHYCSNDSFLSILNTRKIVASALSLSNDSAEGKWIGRIFSQKCLADPQLAPHHEKLVANFESLMGIMGGLGFCLSEDGDLMSQWRGYANNGAGVSIGFNTQYLKDLTGNPAIGGALCKVIYDPMKQSDDLMPVIEDIKKFVDAGAMRSMVGSLLFPTTEEEKKAIHAASSGLWGSYLGALPHLFTCKNPAFREEQEWRLIYYLVGSSAESSIDLPQEIGFRAREDRIVPMRYIALSDAGTEPINQIILGPRNITPEVWVSAALRKYGFKNVQVSRSAATYR